MSVRLYVGRLAYQTTKETLQALFEQVGAVQSVTLIPNPEDPSKNKGFGFVEMVEEADANKAIETLDGQEVDGRPITVNVARPREDRPSNGGGNFGGNKFGGSRY